MLDGPGGQPCCLLGVWRAGLSRAWVAAWGFLSFLRKVFCSSPQSVPESAELKRVCAHVRVNWAMLEGEDSSLACFSRVMFSCGHSSPRAQYPAGVHFLG